MAAFKPARLLHETLERTAQRLPHKTAIVCEGEEISYRQLNERAHALAAFMQAQRLSRGDRVGIFFENSLEAAISLYATSIAGGAFVLINPQTKTDKLAYVLRNSGIGILLCGAALATVAGEAARTADQVRLLIVSGEPKAGTELTVPRADFAEAARFKGTPAGTSIIPLDLAALIYTSGSTGDPKGVMHTHQSMVFALGSLVEYLELDEHDVILNALPLAFDYGLYQLLMSVHVGAKLVLERSFTYPGVVLKKLRDESVTVFPGVPTTFAMLISNDVQRTGEFPQVRCVTNTGAALPPPYLPRIRHTFPNARIYAMYGLTECKRVSYLEPELLERKPNSVGRAIPGTEVFLLSADGEAVPPGTAGILHVRGPHVMLGYWKAPEASERMLRPGRYPGEKVLCTGDWFTMDEDGHLYFVGRSDDIIKSRGEKVSPVEVEEALLRVGGVAEAAVIGVPDEVLGESIKAYVVLCHGATLSARQIQRAVHPYLEAFMVPQEIVVVAALPRSANGKVAKSELRP